MPSTLFDSAAREVIRARVDRLTPQHAAKWGKFDAGRMIVHLTDQLRAALGEMQCAPKNTPFRNPILKRLIIYWLPWPQGAPTAPEFLARPPAAWEEDIAALRAAMDRFGARTPADAWPEHPTFGKLSGRMWGVLAWRHMDHHLRQFGV
jgi:hypothetical protein